MITHRDAVEKATVTECLEKLPTANSSTEVYKIELKTYIAANNTKGIS